MEGCSGLSCGQGKSAREEANLWSASLKDLLSSCDGRTQFKDFLDENGLEDEAKTVDFWERCNDIITDYKKLKKTGRSRKYDPQETAKFISLAKEVILSYVDSREINLDEGLIKRLKDSVEKSDDNGRIDPEKIHVSFHEARETALMLLKHEHALFADHLNKKYQ